MAKKQIEHNHDHEKDPGSLFIPGGVILGVGIGLALGNPGAGALIGLGAGFILWAISKFAR